MVELQPDATDTLTARVLATNSTPDDAACDLAIRRWLPHDLDIDPFLTHAQTDAVLWALIAPCVGLRNFRAGNAFEALVTTIIEQQIALITAQRAERWLIEMFGDALEYDGERYAAFPTPERIAALSIEDLHPLKITFRRMTAILHIARAMTTGQIDLESLTDDGALTTINGVGAWTAAWTTIRARGVYPYMGSADVALRAAVNRYVYGARGRADRAVTDALFARYGTHAGIAAFYTLMRYAFESYPSKTGEG